MKAIKAFARGTVIFFLYSVCFIPCFLVAYLMDLGGDDRVMNWIMNDVE